jgi:hypothetical protein
MTEDLMIQIAKIVDPGAFMKTATLYADMHSQLVAVRKARQILDLLQIKRVDDVPNP